jgi:hypothetical protein
VARPDGAPVGRRFWPAPWVACSSSPEPAPAACPAALFLDGAEQTAVYTPGAGTAPRPDQLRYLAALSDLSSACRYVDEGVEMDLTFNLTAGRGPAFSSTPEEVTYFIATVGPDQRILKRDAYSAELNFEEGYAGARWSEQLTLLIRSIGPGQGSYYTLFIGFQLDDEELQRREQPLLR